MGGVDAIRTALQSTQHLIPNACRNTGVIDGEQEDWPILFFVGSNCQCLRVEMLDNPLRFGFANGITAEADWIGGRDVDFGNTNIIDCSRISLLLPFNIA